MAPKIRLPKTVKKPVAESEESFENTLSEQSSPFEAEHIEISDSENEGHGMELVAVEEIPPPLQALEPSDDERELQKKKKLKQKEQPSVPSRRTRSSLRTASAPSPKKERTTRSTTAETQAKKKKASLSKDPPTPRKRRTPGSAEKPQPAPKQKKHASAQREASSSSHRKVPQWTLPPIDALVSKEELEELRSKDSIVNLPKFDLEKIKMAPCKAIDFDFFAENDMDIRPLFDGLSLGTFCSLKRNASMSRVRDFYRHITFHNDKNPKFIQVKVDGNFHIFSAFDVCHLFKAKMKRNTQLVKDRKEDCYEYWLGQLIDLQGHPYLESTVLKLKHRVLYCAVYMTLFPRGGSLDTITTRDAKFIVNLKKQIPVNLKALVFQHMQWCIEQNRPLPYAHVVMELLEKRKVNCEPLSEDDVWCTDIYGEATLRKMGFTASDEGWVKKEKEEESKKRKRPDTALPSCFEQDIISDFRETRDDLLMQIEGLAAAQCQTQSMLAELTTAVAHLAGKLSDKSSMPTASVDPSIPTDPVPPNDPMDAEGTPTESVLPGPSSDKKATIHSSPIKDA